MSEALAPAPASDRAPRSIRPRDEPLALGGIRGWWQRLREPNAIWMREMRQSARLARTPWILLVLVLAPALLLSTIGGLAASSSTSPAELGGMLFQTFFSIAYFVVVISGPWLAANGIAAEREGRTWEAVLLTGMTPKEIGRGKFLTAYTAMALYIVALAPVGALSFLFGGVTAGEVVIAFALLFLLAALAVAFGLAVSSLWSNSRGAIVVTLMLAFGLGPMLFSIGGVACSLLAHRLWPDVPEGMPIWLPLAYQRAPLGRDYAVLLVAFPSLLTSIPAWLLYESTISNLTSEADDRSSGLKWWFVCSTPVVALAGSVPSLLASDEEARAALSVTAILVFALYLLLCALLFAAEPPGPSRRVEVRWQRAGAGVVTRFFGPGLFRTMLLVVLLCVCGIATIAIIDWTALALGPTVTRKDRYLDQIVLVASYATPYCVFSIGLVAWLRSRSASAWIPRIIAVGVFFLIAVAPWVAAAIAGALADSSMKSWILIAAPSPFFLVSMLAELGSYAHDQSMTIPTGMIFAVAWGFLGILLLAVAKHRGDGILAERNDVLKRAQAAYETEDRAVLDASGAPPPVADAPEMAP
jgi:ABC-type transport system involved in multi-copper enzyme maturation permease subunit